MSITSVIPIHPNRQMRFCRDQSALLIEWRRSRWVNMSILILYFIGTYLISGLRVDLYSEFQKSSRIDPIGINQSISSFCILI